MADGRLILQEVIGGSGISIKGLAPGNYLFRITRGTHDLGIRRLVVVN